MRYLTNIVRSSAALRLSRGVTGAPCAALLLLVSCGGSGGGATSQGSWSWESGSNGLNASGVYGTQGVAAAANVPGAREGATAWRTASGDMWLFGGSDGETSATKGSLNDLWRYSATTGQWTWISGSSQSSAPGVYGSQGVAASSNVPGARNLAVSWSDGAGMLWLFGGIGHDATGNSGNLNDLWKFDPTSNLWTWVSGSNVAGASGVYGSKETSAPTNVPQCSQQRCILG